MAANPTIAMFGSSLVSAYWNGAATYYRGVIQALNSCGFDVTFYEPDAYERHAHRDMPDPEWARVVVYSATLQGVEAALEQSRHADIIIKASGIGVFDEFLEAEVLRLRAAGNAIIFWDVDAPATLERMRGDPEDKFRRCVPAYDLILTYGGGQPVVAAYEKFGAKRCVPIYNAVDPQTHHAAPQEARFGGDLGFLGNRLPDRERRVDEFFLEAARRLPRQRFVLGGSGWQQDIELPPNVRAIGHVYTRDHNAFNCSPRAVLNVNRDSMAKIGYSPPTRVFEAAGAGACLICDTWEGIGEFLAPATEVICVRSGAEVATTLAGLGQKRARLIGDAARRRVLAQHTYQHRAVQLRSLFEGRSEMAVWHSVRHSGKNSSVPVT